MTVDANGTIAGQAGNGKRVWMVDGKVTDGHLSPSMLKSVAAISTSNQASN